MVLVLRHSNENRSILFSLLEGKKGEPRPALLSWRPESKRPAFHVWWELDYYKKIERVLHCHDTDLHSANLPKRQEHSFME